MLTPPIIKVYPPTNLRKNFVPTKFWQIFKLSPLIIMVEGGRNHGYWIKFINEYTHREEEPE